MVEQRRLKDRKDDGDASPERGIESTEPSFRPSRRSGRPNALDTVVMQQHKNKDKDYAMQVELEEAVQKAEALSWLKKMNLITLTDAIVNANAEAQSKLASYISTEGGQASL